MRIYLPPVWRKIAWCIVSRTEKISIPISCGCSQLENSRIYISSSGTQRSAPHIFCPILPKDRRIPGKNGKKPGESRALAHVFLLASSLTLVHLFTYTVSLVNNFFCAISNHVGTPLFYFFFSDSTMSAHFDDAPAEGAANSRGNVFFPSHVYCVISPSSWAILQPSQRIIHPLFFQLTAEG